MIMRAKTLFFLATITVLINPVVRSDTNTDDNLKKLLSDSPVTDSSKVAANEDKNIHPDVKDEKKKSHISVVGIDDDGKRTDAVLKSPDNSSNVEESLETDSKNKNDQMNKNEDSEVVKNETETETIEEAFLPAKGAEEKEHSSSLAIFFVLFVLVLCIFLIHFILQNKCHYIPESLAIVFLGGFVGAIIKLLPNEELSKVESFSPTTFFLVLLPPIIFESGYNLHKGNFFANIVSFFSYLLHSVSCYRK